MMFNHLKKLFQRTVLVERRDIHIESIKFPGTPYKTLDLLGKGMTMAFR